jgi:uncharacterized protein (TIGR02646 family)
MRRVHRRSLALPVRIDLHRRQVACTAATARDDWSRYRGLTASVPVVDTLRAMAGTRQRCFYCRDSRAADVEHFVPITEDADLTFHWANLLWICPECNRRKVNQFPRDEGLPLLIDPVATDPWDHLVLDSATGRLAPRFLVNGTVDSRGNTTLEVITPLNFESVTEGRLLAIRRLRRAANDVLRIGDAPETRRHLRHAVEEDDFGVATWYVAREGRDEAPFVALRSGWPRVWRRFSHWAAVSDLGS